MKALQAAALFSFVFLVACKDSTIKSYQPNTPIAAESEGEVRLWYQADKFDKALVKSKQLFDTGDLQSYLQGLMDTLYPEYDGAIVVHVHKAPLLNAFALPNGSVYVNMGLLAALENEAQIATVLAHEGAHFIEKHSAKQRVYSQNSQGWAVAVSMLGVPFVGQVVAMNAMSGYSVEHETEADTLGYARLKKAGFATSEASRTFEIMARDVKASDVDRPYFFASHPKLQARIDNFTKLNALETDSEQGIVGFERYQKVVGPLRQSILEQKLALGQVAEVIACLEDPLSKKLYGVQHDYLMAVALLKQEGNERQNEAIELLETTLSNRPDFALAHKELGFHYYKVENKELAGRHLQSFIDLADVGEDTAFAKYYLQKLQ